MGRLASVTAKAILQGMVWSFILQWMWNFSIVTAGQRVVVVRCEDLNISGSFYRNKCKWSLAC